MPGTTDFTSAEVQSALHASAGQFLCVVSEGRKAMPGWKETLSAEQIWQTLTYVGSLGKE